jgi:cytochrome c biogenesis protein CcmG/thiol:disulfide interchange protein DsbE
MAEATSAPHDRTKRAARWPYLLPLIVILILGAVFGKRLTDIEGGVDPRLIPTVLLNTPAPEFNLPPLPGRGDAFTTADLKGRVTLVNFWGSWCIACVAEHDILLEIAESGEVPIMGVAWRDTPEKALAWLAKRGDPYDKVGQDPNSRAAIDFGVVAAPESFVIDKQGVIRYKQPGIITREDWEKKIRPLIAELKK